jgi:polyhydroxyalkanoate synthase
MKGEMMLRGERVDLGNIEADVLEVVASEDHIVPPPQSEGAMQKIGSENKTLLQIAGGHIGVMAGSAARHRTWPQIEAWLEPRSGKRDV